MYIYIYIYTYLYTSHDQQDNHCFYYHSCRQIVVTESGTPLLSFHSKAAAKCSRTLQCVAVLCSVFQCVTVCCSVRAKVLFSHKICHSEAKTRSPCKLPRSAVVRLLMCCSVLQCVAVCCSVLQCVAE